MAPTVANAAEGDDVQHCASASAKGGSWTCRGNGATLTDVEKDCFQGAMTGAIPGGLLRKPQDMLVGAVGGCVSAATAR